MPVLVGNTELSLSSADFTTYEGTALTYEILDSDTSAVLQTGAFEYNNATPTFADVQVGPISSNPTSRNLAWGLNIYELNSTNITASGITNYGYDWMAGTQTSIPDGTNRVTSSDGISISGYLLEHTLPSSDATVSVRPFITNGTDTTYGPIYSLRILII